ncbi:MAG: hypothetical protein DRG82_08680 [Deltaproteobacteria bacterium]|nr:MAG: hypothetical protein DRG82_08680 [Deltaproteobacteria bacterium]
MLYDCQQKINDLFVRALVMVSDDPIAVYEHPNPHIKSFFIPGPIWPPRVEIFRPPLDQTSQDRVKRLGNIGTSVVRDLLAIPGVIELRTRPSEILLKKSRTASWEDIVPRALKILRRALRKQQIHLVKS